jgi:hypothetical protein
MNVINHNTDILKSFLEANILRDKEIKEEDKIKFPFFIIEIPSENFKPSNVKKNKIK